MEVDSVDHDMKLLRFPRVACDVQPSMGVTGASFHDTEKGIQHRTLIGWAYQVTHAEHTLVALRQCLFEKHNPLQWL